MAKTVAATLLESAMRSDERGAHEPIYLTAATARRVAEMLESAWLLGSPELRRYLANKDEGYADLWMQNQ